MASRPPKRRRLRTLGQPVPLSYELPSSVAKSAPAKEVSVIELLDEDDEPFSASSAKQAPKSGVSSGPSALAVVQPLLLAALRRQVAAAHELRVAIESDLAGAFEAWLEKDPAHSAEEAVRQMLEPLVGDRGLSTPASVLAAAVEEATGVGLPVSSELPKRLEELCQEEDREGIWRCLCTALSEADRLGVAFWSNEAQQMGFELPKELQSAMTALRQEEAARLKRMEGDAAFAAHAAEAHTRGDVALLRSLIEDAEKSGQDPSAAMAALADLTGEEAAAAAPPEEEPQQEEELERLFVSSPNGQNHCFGMYVLVPEERGNGFPVWRQLGGERWIYSDEMGRWCVGSNTVRESNFRGSAGFLFCPQKHHGAQPDKMQVWCRFDEDTKKWKKDEEISIASEYVDEVAESRASKKAKGKAAKSKGRGGRGKGRGKTKAEPKPAPKPRAAPPLRGEARAPPPVLRPSNGMTRAKALSILGFGPQQAVTAQGLRKAYRGQALRWHPDRHSDPAAKKEASQKFVELRNALELLEADLSPLRLMQAFEAAAV